MKGMCGGTVGTVVRTFSGKERRSGEEKNLGEGKCGRKSKRGRDTLREGKIHKGGEARGNGIKWDEGKGSCNGENEGGKGQGRGNEGNGNRARVAEKTERGGEMNEGEQ